MESLNDYKLNQTQRRAATAATHSLRLAVSCLRRKRSDLFRIQPAQKLMVLPDTNDPKQTIKVASVGGFASESEEETEIEKKAIRVPRQQD